MLSHASSFRLLADLPLRHPCGDSYSVQCSPPACIEVHGGHPVPGAPPSSSVFEDGVGLTDVLPAGFLVWAAAGMHVPVYCGDTYANLALVRLQVLPGCGGHKSRICGDLHKRCFVPGKKYRDQQVYASRCALVEIHPQRTVLYYATQSVSIRLYVLSVPHVTVAYEPRPYPRHWRSSSRVYLPLA